MPFGFYNEQDNEKTIFMPIAACNEYFIEHTIKGAMSLAKYPERIFFGVFNNITDKNKSLIDNDFLTKSHNIFYTEIFSLCPLGTGFGRMGASLLSTQQHDYVFQIDSHSILSKDWDVTLIDTFKKISHEQNTDKIVLTAMCGNYWHYDKNNREKIFSGGFDLDNFSIESFYDNDYATTANIDNGVTEIYFDGYQGNDFNSDLLGKPITHSASRYINGEYEETNCLCAAVLFSKYDICRDVMHDPADPFSGDQVNYAIRLFSRGYKVFNIKQPLVMTLAKLINKDNKLIDIDEEYSWRVPDGFKRTDFIKHFNKVADKNYRDIVNENYFGYWGAPDKESLRKAKEKMGYPKSPPSGLN